MAASSKNIFVTIRTEGALLPVELLQRLAENDRELKGIKPADYHLPPGERLNEAINRSWQRLTGFWRAFKSQKEKLPETDAGTTLTRERWLLPLFNELGYGRLVITKSHEIDGRSYGISHLWQNTPIHFVSFRNDLDSRMQTASGSPRMSPHSLLQEFLNRSNEHLWGLVSNGLGLRILRDNASLTRQAYVDFDLEGMMEGEVYSDFVILYLLAHQSRVEAEKPEECWLELWSKDAQERGTRALDRLRSGVENAITALGQGFITQQANASLRENLKSGSLSKQDYYRQLLRLVYRLIFMLVAEDRSLLHPEDTSPETKKLYSQYYSLSRIRRIAARRRGTRHADLWDGLKVTFACLSKGEPALGVKPLDGFLFSEAAMPDLENCLLSNDALLDAVRSLSFTQDNRILRPVDYRNIGTEELGSVYEGLLEMHPVMNMEAQTFSLDILPGSERKSSGSYYTPQQLIRCLIDSALEPVLQEAAGKENPEKALLELKVVDPACGSGHFLIAAAHRIAKQLAIARTGEAEPTPEKRREALRDVVAHCIYGVDINPMAVELCKVALWMETLVPGRPLGFLDHRIKCGNSLIGATPELIQDGVPNDAFTALEGDDKAVAKRIKKRNSDERKGILDLIAHIENQIIQSSPAAFAGLTEMPEDTAEQVKQKEAQYVELLKDKAYQRQKKAADLWTASFFWPLTEEDEDTAPTDYILHQFRSGVIELGEQRDKILGSIASRHQFFHWLLEFPEVFDRQTPGFDCMLGNPPWENINADPVEFFASVYPDISKSDNKNKRSLLSKINQTFGLGQDKT